jgi:hypothetical protein
MLLDLLIITAVLLAGGLMLVLWWVSLDDGSDSW